MLPGIYTVQSPAFVSKEATNGACLNGVLETDSIPGQSNVEEEGEDEQGKIGWDGPGH